MKRKLLIALALCLALALGIGGTMAYLTASTSAVENVFTIGKVGLTLTEPEGEKVNYEFKMVPGNEIKKDPTVAVTDGSEDCWLFIKLVKSENFAQFLTYAMADGWTELTGHAGVYFRKVMQADTTKSFSVLKDDQVVVKTDVENFLATKESPEFVEPKLAIKAAAIQLANIADEQTAYNNLPDAFKAD